MAKTVAYYEARIDALYAQLVELEDSAAAEYQLDNGKQSQSVVYRQMAEITKQLEWYERKVSRLNSKGGRALAILRRGGY